MVMNSASLRWIVLIFAIIGFLSGLVLHLVLNVLAPFWGPWVSSHWGRDLILHALPATLGLVTFLALLFNPYALGLAFEILQEWDKIHWPSQKEVVAMTWAVLLMVLLIALLVGLFDLGVGSLTRLLIS